MMILIILLNIYLIIYESILKLLIGSPVSNHADQVSQTNAVIAYRQLGTTTSPVMSNLVREDLTTHVKTWPADILAKQVIYL